MKLGHIFFIALTLSLTEALNLRVVTLENPPFIIVAEDGTNLLKGFIPELLALVSRRSGIQYNVTLVQNARYGSRQQSSGQWTGLVGMLINNEADLIAADLTISSMRAEVIDFTFPFATVPLTVMMKEAVAGNIFNYLSPFSVDMWVVTLVSFFVTACLLWIVARIAPGEESDGTFRTTRDAGCVDGTAWYLFSIFFRGSDCKPRALSVRLLIAAWWIVALLIIAVYLMTLGFMIASRDSRAQARDLGEVLSFPVEISAVKGGSTMALLESSPDPQVKKLYSRIFETHVNNDAGVAELKQRPGGTYGYIMEGSAATNLRKKDCSLYTVGTISERNYGFGVRKGLDQVREAISKAILELQHDGTLGALSRKWFSAEDVCSRSGSVFQGAPLTQTSENHAAIFIFLLVMIILSLVVSLIERVVIAKRRNEACMDGMKTAFKCDNSAKAANVE